jgi:AcrR family transcriptional regulator
MATEKPISIHERKTKQHSAIRNDILQIARRMMKEDGVAALSFNAIARELGIKPPSLYTYYDSKNAIYDALFRQGFELFRKQMFDRPYRGGSAEKSPHSAITVYMQFAIDNPDLYQLMFQRPVPDFVPSQESMAVSWDALVFGQQEVATIMDRGEIDSGLPPDETQDLIIALTHGLTELHLANNPDLPIGQGRFGKLIDQSVGLIMKAWATSR